MLGCILLKTKKRILLTSSTIVAPPVDKYMN